MAKQYTATKIDCNKVYSSYFSMAIRVYPDSKLISVALGTPDYFNGGFLRELNPTPSMISGIKNKTLTEDKYTEQYNYLLSLLNPYEIYEKLKGKIICCHEVSNKFCHRHLIIKWLRECLGNEFVGGEIEYE